MQRSLFTSIFWILSASLFFGCTAPRQTSTSPAGDPLAGQYTIKGGGSAIVAVKSLTESFARAHPGVLFDLEDVGSDGGVDLAAEGNVDLGMISRDLKPGEFGRVETLPVGASATGIVVNVANSVRGLTKAQLKDIFTGALTDWAQVGGPAGPISVFVREQDSSTRVSFDGYVFGAQAQMTRGAVEVFELGPMLNAIKGLRGGIGMATANRNALADSGIRYLDVDGIPVTTETIKSGEYPIRRPLYLTYRAGTLKPAIEAFLEYVRGPEGQRLVASF